MTHVPLCHPRCLTQSDFHQTWNIEVKEKEIGGSNMYQSRPRTCGLSAPLAAPQAYIASVQGSPRKCPKEEGGSLCSRFPWPNYFAVHWDPRIISQVCDLGSGCLSFRGTCKVSLYISIFDFSRIHKNNTMTFSFQGKKVPAVDYGAGAYV